jgi:polyisoprenoid-binding protein YceI
MNSIKALLLASLVTGSVAAVQAAPLKTDLAASGVSAVFKQMNVPVEAPFRTFAAQIDYDAAKPAAASASVEITTASFDIGDAMYNKEVAKKEWFNSAQFPKATFVSTSIAPAGAGRCNAGRDVFEGQLPIKRLAFNIGEGEWKDTSMVADEVVIKFRVTAAPAVAAK